MFPLSRDENSICNVVWDTSQFSWTNDGLSDWVVYEEEWHESLNTAYRLMPETVRGWMNRPEDPTNGGLAFHAAYISPPTWTRQLNRSNVIGQHIFYHIPNQLYRSLGGDPDELN